MLFLTPFPPFFYISSFLSLPLLSAGFVPSQGWQKTQGRFFLPTIPGSLGPSQNPQTLRRDFSSPTAAQTLQPGSHMERRKQRWFFAGGRSAAGRAGRGLWLPKVCPKTWGVSGAQPLPPPPVVFPHFPPLLFGKPFFQKNFFFHCLAGDGVQRYWLMGMVPLWKWATGGALPGKPWKWDAGNGDHGGTGGEGVGGSDSAPGAAATGGIPAAACRRETRGPARSARTCGAGAAAETGPGRPSGESRPGRGERGGVGGPGAGGGKGGRPGGAARQGCGGRGRGWDGRGGGRAPCPLRSLGGTARSNNRADPRT